MRPPTPLRPRSVRGSLPSPSCRRRPVPARPCTLSLPVFSLPSPWISDVQFQSDCCTAA